MGEEGSSSAVQDAVCEPLDLCTNQRPADKQIYLSLHPKLTDNGKTHFRLHNVCKWLLAIGSVIKPMNCLQLSLLQIFTKFLLFVKDDIFELFNVIFRLFGRFLLFENEGVAFFEGQSPPPPPGSYAYKWLSRAPCLPITIRCIMVCDSYHNM
jgi:hypothetical protein